MPACLMRKVEARCADVVAARMLSRPPRDRRACAERSGRRRGWRWVGVRGGALAQPQRRRLSCAAAQRPPDHSPPCQLAMYPPLASVDSSSSGIRGRRPVWGRAPAEMRHGQRASPSRTPARPMRKSAGRVGIPKQSPGSRTRPGSGFRTAIEKRAVAGGMVCLEEQSTWGGLCSIPRAASVESNVLNGPPRARPASGQTRHRTCSTARHRGALG